MVAPAEVFTSVAYSVRAKMYDALTASLAYVTVLAGCG